MVSSRIPLRWAETHEEKHVFLMRGVLAERLEELEHHSSEELPSVRDEAPSLTDVEIANLLMTVEDAKMRFSIECSVLIVSH